MNKKVTVIIPAYNAEKCISRSVISCIEQSYPSVEIIIINDGSTDKTSKILHDRFIDNDHVIIKDKANEGVGKARNDGIALATGYYLYFLDADDYLEPDAIELMVEALERDNADIAISGYAVKKDERYSCTLPKLDANSTPLENFILDKIISSPWAKLFRTDIVREHAITFSSHKIMQDGFFNVRYFCEVGKIAIVDKALYIYDKGLSTSTATISEKKLRLIISAMEEQREIAKEHSNLPQKIIQSFFMVRRMRLAIFFPLQCGSRDKIIREECKLLVEQGLLTLNNVSLHEKVLITAFLLHNRCYDLANLLLTYAKRLIR